MWARVKKAHIKKKPIGSKTPQKPCGLRLAHGLSS